MTLHLPDELRVTFMVFTGDMWPAADEDALRRHAADLDALAASIRRFGDSAGAAADGALAAFSGPAADVLRDSVERTLHGGTLDDVATGVEAMARQAEATAQHVEYTKLVIILQLAALAAQIAFLLYMAPWTAGGSSSLIPALILAGQMYARAKVGQLMGQAAGRAASFAVKAVAHTMAQFGAGLGLQVGVDAAAQLGQMLFSDRDHWDHGLTRVAAGTGAIGAGIGTLGSGAASIAMSRLRGAVSDAGRARLDDVVDHRLVNTAARTVGDGTHELSTDLTSTLAHTGSIEDSSWFSLTAGGVEGLAEGLLRKRGARSDVLDGPDVADVLGTGLPGPDDTGWEEPGGGFGSADPTGGPPGPGPSTSPVPAPTLVDTAGGGPLPSTGGPLAPDDAEPLGWAGGGSLGPDDVMPGGPAVGATTDGPGLGPPVPDTATGPVPTGPPAGGNDGTPTAGPTPASTVGPDAVASPWSFGAAMVQSPAGDPPVAATAPAQEPASGLLSGPSRIGSATDSEPTSAPGPGATGSGWTGSGWTGPGWTGSGQQTETDGGARTTPAGPDAAARDATPVGPSHGPTGSTGPDLAATPNPTVADSPDRSAPSAGESSDPADRVQAPVAAGTLAPAPSSAPAPVPPTDARPATPSAPTPSAPTPSAPTPSAPTSTASSSPASAAPTSVVPSAATSSATAPSAAVSSGSTPPAAVLPPVAPTTIGSPSAQPASPPTSSPVADVPSGGPPGEAVTTHPPSTTAGPTTDPTENRAQAPASTTGPVASGPDAATPTDTTPPSASPTDTPHTDTRPTEGHRTDAGLYLGPGRGTPLHHAQRMHAPDGYLTVVLRETVALERLALQVEADPRLVADPGLRIQLVGQATALGGSDAPAALLARRLSRIVAGSLHTTWSGYHGELFSAPAVQRDGMLRPGRGRSGFVAFGPDGSPQPGAAPPAVRARHDRDLLGWTGALTTTARPPATPTPTEPTSTPSSRAAAPAPPPARAPSAPARSTPAGSAPARSTPARSAPARSAPARSTPAPPTLAPSALITLADRVLAASTVRDGVLYIPADPARPDPAALAAVTRFGRGPDLTVLAHGRAGGVRFAAELLTGPVLVEVIRRSRVWHGSPVDLAVCWSAAGPHPTTGQVGDGLGVTVRGARRRAYTGPAGLVFDADVTVDRRTGKLRLDLRSATALTGYVPGRGTVAARTAPEVGGVALHAWTEGISAGAPASAMIGGAALSAYSHVGEHQAQGQMDADSPGALPEFFVESGAMGHSGLVESIVPTRPEDGSDLRAAVLDVIGALRTDAAPGSPLRAELTRLLAPLAPGVADGGTPVAVWRTALLDGVELHAGTAEPTAELTLLTEPDARAEARPRPLAHEPAGLDRAQRRWHTNLHAAGTVEGTGSGRATEVSAGFAAVVPLGGRMTASARLLAEIRRGIGTERATTASTTTTSVRRVFGGGRQRAFELAATVRVAVSGHPPRMIPVLLTLRFPVEQAARSTSRSGSSASLSTGSGESAPKDGLDAARAGLFAALPVALESIDVAALRAALTRAAPDVDWSGKVTEAHLLGVGDQLPGAGLSFLVPTRAGHTVQVTVAMAGLGPLQRTSGTRLEVVRLDRRVRLQIVHAARHEVDGRLGGRVDGGPMYSPDADRRAVRAPAELTAGYTQDSGAGQIHSSGIYRKQYLQSAGRVVQFHGDAVLRVTLLDLDDPGPAVEIVENARVHLLAPESDADTVAGFTGAVPRPVRTVGAVLPPSRLARGHGSAVAVVDGLAGGHRVLPVAMATLTGMRAWSPADLTAVRRVLEVTFSLGGLSARWEDLLTRTGLMGTVTVDGVGVDVAVVFRPGAVQHLGSREGAVVEYEGDQSDYSLAPRQWTDTIDGGGGIDVRVPFAGASASGRVEHFRERTTTRGDGTARNSGFTAAGRTHVFGWAGTFAVRVTVRLPGLPAGARTVTASPIPGMLRAQVPEAFTRSTPDPDAGRVAPADPTEVVEHHVLDPTGEQVLDVWGTDALHGALSEMLRGLDVRIDGTVRSALAMLLSPESMRGQFVRMGTERGYTLVLPRHGGPDVLVTLRVFAVPSTGAGRRVSGVRPWWEPEVVALSQESRRSGWARAGTAGVHLGRVPLDENGIHHLDAQVDRGGGASASTLELDATQVRSGLRHVRSGDNELVSLDTVWHVVVGRAGGPPAVRALRVTHGVDLMRRVAAPAPSSGRPGDPGTRPGVSATARTVAVDPSPGRSRTALPGAVEAMLRQHSPEQLTDVWVPVREHIDGRAVHRWEARRGLDPAVWFALTLEQLTLAMPQLLGGTSRIPLSHRPGPSASAPAQLRIGAVRNGTYEHVRTDADDELMSDRVVQDRTSDTSVSESSGARAIEPGYTAFPDGVGGSRVDVGASRELGRTVREDHTRGGRVTVDESRSALAGRVATHAGPAVVTVELVAAPSARFLLRRLSLRTPAALWRPLRGAPPVRVDVVETIVAPAVLHPPVSLDGDPAGAAVTPQEPGTAFPADRALPSRGVVPLGYREPVLREYRERTGRRGGSAAQQRMVETGSDVAAAFGHLLGSALLTTKAGQAIRGGVHASLGTRQGTVADTTGSARLRFELGNPTFEGWVQGRNEWERFAAREEADRSTVEETRDHAVGAGGSAQVLGPATALPTGVLGGPAGGLALHHSRTARHQQEHSVMQGSSSVEGTAGPYALFRVDLMAHLETWVRASNRFTDGAGAATPHLTTDLLGDAMTVALSAHRARALGLVPPGWVPTRTGVYLPPSHPADVDTFVDVLPRFDGWLTVALHLTPDGTRVDSDLGPLDADGLADLLETVFTGLERRRTPPVFMIRGGGTKDALAFLGATGERLGLPVIAAAGRTKVILDQPLLATDRSGPRPWHLLPPARPAALLGHDLVAVFAATGLSPNRPAQWQGEVLRAAITSTRVIGTHRGPDHRNVLLEPANLAKEQARAAHRLPGFTGVTVVIGWSDGGRVAARGTLLDPTGLARWLDEEQVPVTHTVVVSVGGFTGGAELHAQAGGRDVITTLGQWLADADGDLTSVSPEDGSPQDWVRHSTGTAPRRLGSALTPALARLGFAVVPAPQEQVTGLAATLPASALGALHPTAPPAPDVDSAPEPGGAPEPISAAEPGGPPAAPRRTHYGAHLPSPGLSDTAIRHAERLPQVPDWNLVLAGATASGLPLLGDRALDADAVVDLLDRSGVPPLVPHALIAPHGLDVATEVSRRTGRPFVATDGFVETSPDGTVRAYVTGTREPALFHRVGPDGTRTPLRHELGDSLGFPRPAAPHAGQADDAASEASGTSWDDPYDVGSGPLGRIPEVAVPPMPTVRAATPQPPEERSPAAGPLYSADLLPDAATARTLSPGDTLVGDRAATGVRDPAALPPGVTVLTRIVNDPVARGGGPEPIAPGRSYTVLSVAADPLDPDLLRVDLALVAPAAA